jgi:hypothetical protein
MPQIQDEIHNENYHLRLLEPLGSTEWIYLQIKDIIPGITICISKFKNFCGINLQRARTSLKDGMQSWLDTL